MWTDDMRKASSWYMPVGRRAHRALHLYNRVGRERFQHVGLRVSSRTNESAVSNPNMSVPGRGVGQATTGAVVDNADRLNSG